MNASLLGLWLVCGLGSAVFAAAKRLSWRAAVLAVVVFAGTTLWALQPFGPSLPLAGGLAALAAASMLVRPRCIRWAPVVAAALAGLWIPVMVSLRVPVLAAVVLAMAVPASAAWLRRVDSAFAPESMCEEALFGILALGVVVAAAPTVVDGWHAAANLKLQGPTPESAANVAMPVWAISAAGCALISGGLYSLWSRR